MITSVYTTVENRVEEGKTAHAGVFIFFCGARAQWHKPRHVRGAAAMSVAVYIVAKRRNRQLNFSVNTIYNHAVIKHGCRGAALTFGLKPNFLHCQMLVCVLSVGNICCTIRLQCRYQELLPRAAAELRYCAPALPFDLLLKTNRFSGCISSYANHRHF